MRRNPFVLLTALFMLMLFAVSCGDNANRPSKNSSSDNVETAKKAVYGRDDYNFCYSFFRDEYDFCWALVEGVLPDGTIGFSCKAQLMYDEDYYDPTELCVAEDINFDGIPDLCVYLGTIASGTVAAYYDAFVWDVETDSFVHVENYSEIGEPVLHNDLKQISSVVRSGPDELVHTLYEWNGNKLVLIDKSTSPISNENNGSNDGKSSTLMGVRASIESDGRVLLDIDKELWTGAVMSSDFYRVEDQMASGDYYIYTNTDDPARSVLVSKYAETEFNYVTVVVLTESHKIYMFDVNEAVSCIEPRDVLLGASPLSEDMSFKPIRLESREGGELTEIYAIDEFGVEKEVRLASWQPRLFTISVDGVEHVLGFISVWNMYIDDWIGVYRDRYEGDRLFYDYTLYDYKGEGAVSGTFEIIHPLHIKIGDLDPMGWGVGQMYEIEYVAIYD